MYTATVSKTARSLGLPYQGSRVHGLSKPRTRFSAQWVVQSFKNSSRFRVSKIGFFLPVRESTFLGGHREGYNFNSNKCVICTYAWCICNGLLGLNAIAEDKTETGRRLDILGYVVDLGTHFLSIAPKNFLNCLYWFFSVDLNGFTTLLELQRLGCVASRYGLICRFGWPFNAAIHAATWNLRSQVRIRFPLHIKRAIACGDGSSGSR